MYDPTRSLGPEIWPAWEEVKAPSNLSTEQESHCCLVKVLKSQVDRGLAKRMPVVKAVQEDFWRDNGLSLLNAPNEP
jgi:hypothetical protein